MSSVKFSIIAKKGTEARPPSYPVPIPLFLLRLAVYRYTHFSTVGFDRASGAPGRKGPAKGLSEGDEKVIVRNPIFFRKDLSKGEFSLFRSLGVDESEAI